MLVSDRLSLMTSYLELADLTVRLSALFQILSISISIEKESSINLDVDPINEVGSHFQSLLQWYFFLFADSGMSAAAKPSLSAVWQ